MRILSLPCATGEEPYSLAMALLESAFPADHFRIDAVDISAHAISRAQHAVYGKNSFRGKDLGFRDRHFESETDGFRLTESVRRHVHFKQGNLFDAGFLPGAGIYDIIFCRNVLIYFASPTQDRALRVLTRLLTPDGFLFVGPSETGSLSGHFVSVKVPLAFAFQKAKAVPGDAKRKVLHAAKRSSLTRPIPPACQPTPVPLAKPNPAPPPAPPADPKPSIEQVRRLADQGRLSEAARCCEAYLRSHGPSPEAFYLLGLVHDATGNQSESADLYRKALYLDPTHREALVHLAILAEKQGNRAGAQSLNERARRLEQRSKH